MNTATTATDPKFPTFRRISAGLARAADRCLHRLRRIFFSKTSLKICLTTVSLICLAYTGFRWQGRRAWQAERERVEALGMATEWKDLLLPMPADADNFLAAPPFAGLFFPPYPKAPQLRMWMDRNLIETKTGDRNGPLFVRHPDTLAGWCARFRENGTLPPQPAQDSSAGELLADKRWEATIQAVYAAAERPDARIPIPMTGPAYQDENHRFDIQFRLARSLQLYARANLEEGHILEALPVFRIISHLVSANALDTRDSASLTAASHLSFQKPLLLEGMARHALPAGILEKIIKDNYPELLRRSARRSFEYARLNLVSRMERDRGAWWANLKQQKPWKSVLEFATPDYLFMRMAVRYSRFYAVMPQAAAPLEGEESWAFKAASLKEPWNLNFGPIAIFGNDLSQRGQFITWLIQPVVSATLHHLAAALELHYLKYGRYPAGLAELETGLSPGALRDVEGQPFGYSIDAEGAHFTLTSNGLYNTKDIWSTLPANP
ncbi:MAG: hypothetical protein V4726_23665 [Verrucomicrobiota bacterium]